jgi:divalent metal cation (Fe/Co/Zn/Cd) transporter
MFDGHPFIEMHLEVDEKASLSEAHQRATELEDEIRRAVDPQARINIHIEPLGAKIAGAEEMRDLGRSVQKFLNSLQSEYAEIADCHEVHVRSVNHKILVSCHCSMPGNLQVTDVHDVTAALEDRVKENFPQIFRVTIHPEPAEES